MPMLQLVRSRRQGLLFSWVWCQMRYMLASLLTLSKEPEQPQTMAPLL